MHSIAWIRRTFFRYTGATEKSFRNLPSVRIAYAKSLGVYEVIAADRVLFTADALDAIEGTPEVAS